MRYAMNTLINEEVLAGLARHAAGERWDLCQEDVHETELSPEKGFRLFSVHHGQGATKFYIITEADSGQPLKLCEPHVTGGGTSRLNAVRRIVSPYAYPMRQVGKERTPARPLPNPFAAGFCPTRVQ